MKIFTTLENEKTAKKKKEIVFVEIHDNASYHGLPKISFLLKTFMISTTGMLFKLL